MQFTTSTTIGYKNYGKEDLETRGNSVGSFEVKVNEY